MENVTYKVGDLDFDQVGRVTKPLLSLKHTPKLYVQFQSLPRESDITVGETRGKEKMQVADVVNLETGEECLLICSTVLLKNLEKYGDTLVGKYFALIGGDIREGKKYRTVDIYEIRPKAKSVPAPAPEPPVQNPVATGKKK